VGRSLTGPDLLAASPHAIDLAIHHAVGPILLTPLGQTMVTDDTDDPTLGKLFRRGDRGGFPKSASPCVTCLVGLVFRRFSPLFSKALEKPTCHTPKEG
jgi:hypothetical protein